jgi:hypothetical protein
MKNEFYKGIELKEVPGAEKLGMFDINSNQFIPFCYTRGGEWLWLAEENTKEANKLIGSSLETLHKLLEMRSSINNTHDSWIDLKILSYWMEVNPGFESYLYEKIQEKENKSKKRKRKPRAKKTDKTMLSVKKTAAKAKPGAKKRGRPPKKKD